MARGGIGHLDNGPTLAQRVPTAFTVPSLQPEAVDFATSTPSMPSILLGASMVMRADLSCFRVSVGVACLVLSSSIVRAEPSVDPTQSSDAIAYVEGRGVSLREVDRAGGRALYDAAQQLYEARVRALYQLLSDEVLAREARAQNHTVEDLVEQHVNSVVASATNDDVDALLRERPGAAQDARSRREAQLYLNLKRRADRKRTYVESLFERYAVRVSLEAPPSPPVEEVQGALTPAIGPTDAPVTLIVFSDYLCPYCRTLSDTLEQLIARFPKEVRIVYRHYPTQKTSQPLAEAALCASDQGRFAQYHHELFALGGNVPDRLDQAAERAGLTLEPFRECVKSGRHAARITDDVKEGQRLAIQGTPTLFVNGVRLRGAQSVESLDATVREALSKHEKLPARQR